MTFFIKKNRKIKLKCYTNNRIAYELFPITKARNHIPQWWKDIKIPSKNNPEELNKNYGMKGCPGFIEYYKLGYIMPLWTDLTLYSAGKNREFETYAEPSDEFTKVDPHPPYEWSGMYNPKEYMHFKIVGSWLFDCTHSIDWLFGPCHWSTDVLPKRLVIPTGHMNYKLFSATNIQMFMERGDDPVTLNAGMPMMHFIPITERNTEIECIYDPEKYQYMMDKHTRFTFSRIYYKKKKFMKGG